MSTTVQSIRFVVLIFVATSLLAPSLLQPLVDNAWRYLHSSGFYRLSTFETIWTVFSYCVIEPWVTHIFITQAERRLVVQDLRAKNPDASTPRHPHGMKRPSRRGWEGVVYIAPLLLMDFTMIKKYAGVPLRDIALSGGYSLPSFGTFQEGTISNSTTPLSAATGIPRTGHIHDTFLIPTLHNFTLASPLQTQRALPILAPTPLKLFADIVFAFLIYDFLFFVLHLSLHVAPLPFLNRTHIQHHAHPAEMQPQITNALSIPERLSLVLLANFSLNIIGAHVLSRTLFVPLFVWMLVELHSGLDLAVGFEKVLPQGWAVGARKHAEHHRTGRGGYEPFFGWWDALWQILMARRREVKAKGAKASRAPIVQTT